LDDTWHKMQSHSQQVMNAAGIKASLTGFSRKIHPYPKSELLELLVSVFVYPKPKSHEIGCDCIDIIRRKSRAQIIFVL
jgi:hypothetical protein